MKPMTDKTTFYDTSISETGMNCIKFFRLTRNALGSDSDEALFTILIERNALFDSVDQLSSLLSPEYVEKMISIERKILTRLEKEREKIILHIDSISRHINSLKAYSAKFPIPSMPAFFDQTG